MQGRGPEPRDSEAARGAAPQAMAEQPQPQDGEPHEALAQPPPEPVWQRVLRRSIMEFRCPNLESEYQAYVGNQRWGYVLAFAPTFIISWFSIFRAVFKEFREGSTELPPGFLPSMPLFFLPTLALMAFICLRPKAYAKHWRGINSAFMLVHTFSTNPWQQLLLWQAAAIVAQDPSAATRTGFYHYMQAFIIENCYFSIILLRVLTFSTGQASDVVFTVLGMAAAMGANTSLCASSLLGSRSAIAAPLARRMAQGGCAWFLAMLSAHGVIGRCPELSCPALLAFWQILGCALACLLIFGREVVSRRQFLKASTSRFSPSVAAMANSWPLGGPKIVHNLICAVVGVCVAPAILMALALYAFQMPS